MHQSEAESSLMMKLQVNEKKNFPRKSRKLCESNESQRELHIAVLIKYPLKSWMFETEGRDPIRARTPPASLVF